MAVKHKNIVRFLGYCYVEEMEYIDFQGRKVMAAAPQRFLCFECLPKGSFYPYITDARRGLEWKTRYRIIKGICEGLHYLHSEQIVHLDLKPANILLDDHMEPKIADFGLSRCFEEKQSKIITLKACGTPGYMAPECFTGVITFKLDIYSLGVIILEMLTGEKPEVEKGQKGHPEVKDVLESWKSRYKMSQGDNWLEHAVRVCTEIAIKCIDPNPEKRPEIHHIIETLVKTESTYGFIEDVTPISLNPREPEAEEKPQKSLNVKQQALLQTERQATEAAKREHAESERRNEELTKIEQLQETVQRLVEKMTNKESENHVLRQQALAISPAAKSLAAYPKSPFQLKTPENGNSLNGEVKSSPELEAEEKPQKSLDEKQQENQDLLTTSELLKKGLVGSMPLQFLDIGFHVEIHAIEWHDFEHETQFHGVVVA
ncbi:hypothetical protein PVAP13_5NG372100 [Panicum virgatum]|uniref:Protein kinase domain-containing protein n=1 Tax=Panicum virgatum TaxID=38727 RepID=A0A8T0RVQ8_PANVG|nr:hypothetical protein PVAP13_5NG372100 [Panicum virgatum]KAG2589587.1 hypothetical protein PVAP13_5NG372100 [Panicum virgatum]KAG2589589.1 hypothetical protein PVAP13_5NG372100 [Panicum virgatum]KAG2589590.1 hypothetical protein PVAP13_5NG372100 [Panicum virgatum]